MDLLNTIIENIDLMYIVSCNAATYFVIKMIEGARKNKKLGTWYKRLTATIVAIGLGFLMYYGFGHENKESLFYGALIQFLTWDYLFKPIMKMLPQFFSPMGGGGPIGGGSPDDMDP